MENIKKNIREIDSCHFTRVFLPELFKIFWPTVQQTSISFGEFRSFLEIGPKSGK